MLTGLRQHPSTASVRATRMLTLLTDVDVTCVNTADRQEPHTISTRSLSSLSLSLTG